jgi:hypothetical protein
MKQIWRRPCSAHAWMEGRSLEIDFFECALYEFRSGAWIPSNYLIILEKIDQLILFLSFCCHEITIS